jgi:MFS transporter, UMF1 family
MRIIMAEAALDPRTYQRRIRAWTLYDWANSAFATTILAAVLPIYYSQVAGATLPSEATATAYWSLGLSISLFITAILSPILGTVSDVMRGKKKFLAIFTGVGILATGLLVLVDRGDWMLASIVFIIGRIGFNGAYTFYDALLPHVAKPEDRDSVSARGYAMGYLGGGLLLAINVVMIFALPGTWGPRLSFLSVAIWWAVFSIPIFRQVPEPPSATERLKPGETVIGVSFRRLWETLKDLRHYRELFKYLIAFLIYNDAIGTIIGVAAIYGAELGFGSVELILALLLVQFVGIPFSLIFGRLPSPQEKRRPLYLAFIIFNLIALPVVGVVGRSVLPEDMSGAPRTPYETTGSFLGEGVWIATDDWLRLAGNWGTFNVAAAQLGTEQDAVFMTSDEPGVSYELDFYGQTVELTHSTGPDHGIWEVLIDGQPALDDDDQPLRIDAYSPTVRYDVVTTIEALEPGEHTLTVVNTGERNRESGGSVINIERFEVLPPARVSSLPVIIGMIAAAQVIGVVFALIFGRMFTRLAETLDTRRSILLALVVYTIIAIWGYFVDSTVEFWFLAWMVAIVQGGSQALSRSLYASMSPSAKSGEFFGLYGIMERFASIIGPLLFVLAATAFGSSRPAIISLVVFFILGGYLLTRVNIAEGQRIAREEDAALLG